MWQKFRDVRTLGAIGVLAFIGLIGILNLTVFTPEAAVLRYLSAIEDGRVDDARHMVWGDSLPDGPYVGLPADSANRPSGFHVMRTSRVGGEAIVDVSFDLAGQKTVTKFVLAQADNWLPFNDWRFTIEPVATVQSSGSAPIGLRINGVSAGPTALTLVPVVAEVGSGTGWFDSPVVTVKATTPAGVYLAPLKPRATPALVSALDDSVRSYLDDCASQKTLVPAECPFAGFTAMTVTSGPTWSIDTYPTLAIALTDGEWTVSGNGKVLLDVTLVDFATEKAEPYSQVIPFTISGTITGLDTAKPRVVVLNTVEH